MGKAKRPYRNSVCGRVRGERDGETAQKRKQKKDPGGLMTDTDDYFKQ